ncbi:conserved hypothetical protein [Cenarchaeum symbiosum A]|uniref:SIS domain-containing protein n=1 Tax=Cenarchaeum symbiosum (strain A) TaxID=414004 RepID=A0RW31_CENSY|nr:conserved hypothetical protein [Cenarchaeum symbiosum A]
MRAGRRTAVDSIRALRDDVYSQPKALDGFIPQRPLSGAAQKRAIFCGSGDSLAACMLASAHSGMAARSADPLDLLRNPPIPRSTDAYIVSISGRTVSNIRVARLSRRAVAITSNPHSRLTRSCGRTIRLMFPNSDVLTAGSVSFLDSALTCMSLVGPVGIRGARKIFARAESASRRITLQNRVFILGGLQTYPLAMYAAAKLHEVLGMPAHYERTEQFSHMGLFSAKKGDTVLVLERHSGHSERLVRGLRGAGLRAIQPDPGPCGRTGEFLFYTFLSQLVPLHIAEQEGRQECHFMESKRLLALSDGMIY